MQASRWRIVDIPRLLPVGVAPEQGLQVRTILAARDQCRRSPDSKHREVRSDSLRWHPDGLALDVMIPNPGTAEGIALGNEIVAFVLKNAIRFGLQDAIWRGTYYTPNGPQGTGARHYDHVHITTTGGGYPTGREGPTSAKPANDRPETRLHSRGSMSSPPCRQACPARIGTDVVVAGRPVSVWRDPDAHDPSINPRSAESYSAASRPQLLAGGVWCSLCRLGFRLREIARCSSTSEFRGEPRGSDAQQTIFTACAIAPRSNDGRKCDRPASRRSRWQSVRPAGPWWSRRWSRRHSAQRTGASTSRWRWPVVPRGASVRVAAMPLGESRYHLVREQLRVFDKRQPATPGDA